MRASWLWLAAALTAACKQQAREADAAPPDAGGSIDAAMVVAPPSMDGATQEPCVPPVAPRDVVLGIALTSPPREFHSSPGTARHEAGQVTVTGACEKNVDCVHVSAEALASLYALAREASHVRYAPGDPPTVHHGSRAVHVRWAGGSCAIKDDGFHRIVSEDGTTFRASYDAIAAAILAAHDAGK